MVNVGNLTFKKKTRNLMNLGPFFSQFFFECVKIIFFRLKNYQNFPPSPPTHPMTPSSLKTLVATNIVQLFNYRLLVLFFRTFGWISKSIIVYHFHEDFFLSWFNLTSLVSSPLYTTKQKNIGVILVCSTSAHN